MTFEESLEEFFKCSSCGQALNLKKNEKLQNAFIKQIDKIRKDMQN
jgi:transcription initiation factor IIE alpha subunit